MTVVIPTYDRWPRLEVAVSCALAQVGVRVEVVVVDDASPEPAPDPPPGPLGDERVRILRRARRAGPGPARDAGAAIGRGEWIAYLDDDDLWAPDHLAQLVDAAERRGAGFAYSAAWVVDEAGRDLRLRPAPDPADLLGALVAENAIGTPSCVIARRDLVRRVGGFDAGFAVMADWDLWLRLAAAAVGAASPRATIAYVEHPANMSLDVARVLAEYDALRRRHGALVTRRGEPLGGKGFPRWIARTYRRTGDRRRAARWFLRSAVLARNPRDALRAVVILLGEPSMRAAHRVWPERRGPAPEPPMWLSGRLGGAAREA